MAVMASWGEKTWEVSGSRVAALGGLSTGVELDTANNDDKAGSPATYCYGSVQNRSDGRDKTDIRDTDLGLAFLRNLRPVKFRWDYREDYREHVEEDYTDEKTGEKRKRLKTIEHPKDGSRKRKRYHEGLIAQEVKAVMDEMGVDFAGYQDHSVNGGQDVLSIGYQELITPIIKAVQELAAQDEALELRMAALEAAKAKS